LDRSGDLAVVLNSTSKGEQLIRVFCRHLEGFRPSKVRQKYIISVLLRPLPNKVWEGPPPPKEDRHYCTSLTEGVPRSGGCGQATERSPLSYKNFLNYYFNPTNWRICCILVSAIELGSSAPFAKISAIYSVFCSSSCLRVRIGWKNSKIVSAKISLASL